MRLLLGAQQEDPSYINFQDDTQAISDQGTEIGKAHQGYSKANMFGPALGFVRANEVEEDFSADKAFDGKSQQDGDGEEQPRYIHEVVVPAVVIQQVPLHITGEGGVASEGHQDHGDKGDQDRGMSDFVPFGQGGVIDGTVEKESVVVAHEGFKKIGSNGHVQVG